MTVQESFDKYASLYDLSRRRLIPNFDGFYGAVLEILPFAKDRMLNVLDLGAGTGLLSEMLVKSFPVASFTLIDVSGRMLEQAKERLSAYHNSFTYLQDDYEEVDSFDGSFDLVVSALSIHHLTQEAKLNLFQNVYDSLNPGGLFINADQVLGATPVIDMTYQEMWLRQVREHGVTEDELAAALERMQDDKMATLEFQLKGLKKSGFQNVNCWYKQYSFAVYSGEKRDDESR